MGSVVPKIIAIVAGIVLAAFIASSVIKAAKGATGGIIRGAESAISSVTGQTIDMGGQSAGSAGDINVQGIQSQGGAGLNFQ